MKKITSLLFLFSCVLSIQAEKIATINMEKVFDGYYRTMVENETIEKSVTSIKDSLIDQEKHIKELEVQYRKLMSESTNIAFTKEKQQEKRDKAREIEQIARKKMKQLQIDERTKRVEIAQLNTKIKKELVSEIRKRIQDVAKAQGYDIILDSSAVSATGVQNLIYGNPKIDITDSILSSLNEGQQELIAKMKKIAQERAAQKAKKNADKKTTP